MVAYGVFVYFLNFCLDGILLATALGGVLALIGRKLVPNTAPGRSGFLWMCFRRPFLLIPWTLLVFIAYSYANGIIFHRDNGLGVNGHVPLPDGYLLGYVNYHPGYILTPETVLGTFPDHGPGTIDGVTEMQVEGPYVLGSRYPASMTKFDDWKSASGNYFLLDTRTKSVATFVTLDELRRVSASKGMTLSLESPTNVYSRYRRTWFDSSLPVVSAIGLVALLASLWRRARQIQHQTSGPRELTSIAEEQSTAPPSTFVSGE